MPKQGFSVPAVISSSSFLTVLPHDPHTSSLWFKGLVLMDSFVSCIDLLYVLASYWQRSRFKKSRFDEANDFYSLSAASAKG